VARWRPRYRLRLRDIAELFLARGFVCSHEAVRDREARCALLLAARWRARRRGTAGSDGHADATSGKVDGRWRSRYRAIDRAGNLVEAPLSERRDMDAAQRFFHQALAVAGKAPDRVTTDGHDASPRALRATRGGAVVQRTSRYTNKRIEQDHRGSERRYHPMRGCGSVASAARFASACEERRQYCRARGRSGEPLSLAVRRQRSQGRWAAVMAALAAA